MAQDTTKTNLLKLPTQYIKASDTTSSEADKARKKIEQEVSSMGVLGAKGMDEEQKSALQRMLKQLEQEGK